MDCMDLYELERMSTIWLCRLRAVSKSQAEGPKKPRTRDRGAVRAFPAPEANAELQSNLEVCLISCFYQPSFFFFNNCCFGLLSYCKNMGSILVSSTN